MKARPRARFAVGALHRRNRRTQAKLTERGEHFGVILEAARAQRMPRNFTGGILADELLSFALGHGRIPLSKRTIHQAVREAEIEKEFRPLRVPSPIRGNRYAETAALKNTSASRAFIAHVVPSAGGVRRERVRFGDLTVAPQFRPV